jgi:hypothetical protein
MQGCSTRTDRHDEAKSRFLQFCERAKNDPVEGQLTVGNWQCMESFISICRSAVAVSRMIRYDG